MLAKTKRIAFALALVAAMGLGATLFVTPQPAEAVCPPFCDLTRDCPDPYVAATECGVPVCVKLCIYSG